MFQFELENGLLTLKAAPTWRPLLQSAPQMRKAQRAPVKTPIYKRTALSFLNIQLCGGDPPLPPAATPLWAVYKQEPGRRSKPSKKTDG